jgi:uncharacterized protein YidB (DUF937 family)
MERIVRRIGLVGVVPVAVTAVAGAGILLALDDNPASADDSTGNGSLWSSFLANQEPETDQGIAVMAAPLMGDQYLERLAENLGVSVDQLREAMKKTALEMLDEAVANGDIPEEMADELREAIEEGALPHAGGGFLMPGKIEGFGGPGISGFFFGGPLGDDQELATFLGISPNTLRDELDSGKTLAQVGEAHGKSRDEVKSFLKEQQEARIAEAVENGRLSEAQAEKLRSNIDEHIEHKLDGTFRIHIEGDGPLPGGFGGEIERFFGGGQSRAVPWQEKGQPQGSAESEDDAY